MDNGLTAAKWELLLPGKMSGLVRVVPSGGNEPALTWRPGGALDRIPIWQPGVYTVTIGSREFRDLKATERTL